MKIRKLTASLILSLSLALQTAWAIPDPDEDGSNPPWIAQFSVSPSFAKVGKPVPVQWQTLFTTGCVLSSNQTSSVAVPTSGSASIVPTSANIVTVTLRCTGGNNTSTSSRRSFDVNRADHPELNSLTLNKDITDAGDVVTLSWESAFSDYCELSGTNSARLATNGSETFTVRDGTNNFRMVCKSDDGRESNPLFDSVIGLDPFPRISNLFITITSDNTYNVVWFASADSCTLDFFSVPTSGSRSFFNSTNPTNHVLECLKNGYRTSRTITFRASTNGGIHDDPIGGGDDGEGNQY